MNITGQLAPDGAVHMPCPRPGCGAPLVIRPRSPLSRVTCRAAGCGHQFVLEVPELKQEPPTAQLPTTPTYPVAGTDREPPPPPIPQSSKPATSNSISRQPSAAKRHPRQKQSSAPAAQSRTLWIVAGIAAGIVLTAGASVAIYFAFLNKPATPTIPGSPVAEAPQPVDHEPEVDQRPKAKPAERPKVVAPPIPKTVPEPETPEIGPEPRVVNGEQPLPKTTTPDGNDSVNKEDILARTKRATALIEGKASSGSAFVVGSGLLVTNAHVLDGELLDDLKVRFVSLVQTDPKPIKPVLIYKDRRRDLAILRITESPEALALAPAGTVLEGLHVAVVGNPAGEGGILKIGEVTTGSLKAPARLPDGQIFYELSVEAAPGNSGGPVIDETTGKVVGVLTAGVPGQPKTFCIPVGELAKAVERLPSDGDAEAHKQAAARHTIDYVAVKLPAIENNAYLAMQLQLLRLKNNSDSVSLTVGDKTYQFVDIMSELKDRYGRTFQTIQKLVKAHVTANPEVAGSLKQLIKERLDACSAMRGLANARTELETTFVREMESRKTASDRKAKAFETEYGKYLSQLDQKYASPPK